MRRWVRNISIISLLSAASSIVAIVTADYTFPVPRATVSFGISLTEGAAARLVADIKKSAAYKDLRRQCDIEERTCDIEDIAPLLMDDSGFILTEYLRFVIHVENRSTLEVRNVHVSFVAKSASGDVIMSDYLKHGSNIGVDDYIQGSSSAEDWMYDIEEIDVCISYRGRYHIDIIREEYTMHREDAVSLTPFSFTSTLFSQRGSISRSAGFETDHCPQSFLQQ